MRYSRGFRSLKLIEDVVVWVGILIGPLFLKDLFLFAVFYVNNKVSDKKCKAGILTILSFFVLKVATFIRRPA